jgi:CxxC motif-containing protein (DUF1111 family)
MSFVLVALAACNGGTNADDASANAAAQSRTTAAAAAGTANGVRATIESLRRGGGGLGTSGSFTPPPSSAKDRGPRDETGAAGGHYDTLFPAQIKAFEVGLKDFNQAEDVADGLGPTFNADSCGSCHAYPAVGGSSPKVNPQAALANGANRLPSFISVDGPVREARFVSNTDGSPDGGVHGLFTISGRKGADGCSLRQPDFAGELARNNVIFRIPTPMFGAGLMESIPDSEILKNQAKSASTKQSLGIRGRPNVLLTGNSISGQANHNGNDGTIGRFGWKAQNKSLLIFSGEAYNVEMGITNSAFPTERDETESCLFAPTPNSEANLEATDPVEALGSIEKFTLFMRMLAPPKPSTKVAGATATSIENGRQLFTDTGCALCHTPSLNTYPKVSVPAMSATSVNLYSDLLLHDMGTGLADGVQQGQASGREFRSAPLWGLGQRLFFLHDGRTSDLRQAILEHYSSGSEANVVTRTFFALPDGPQQDLLNFLRSL